ncbi:MAG: MBL fold metallo-hydrolase, partial [Rhodoferax sp.]|uniref:MBL fold metallo-hydrolase n=1 Tax=Rhodoferax sp. TaxID=50421 RepID=UPI003262CD2E
MAYTLCSPSLPTASYATSPQFSDGTFRNPVPRHAIGTWKTLTLLWRFMVDKPALASPAQPLPVLALTQAELLAAPDKSLWRFGHSTMLLKMDGKFWLTDPVFAERASQLQFIGPKRFHAPPMGIADLPPITGVILSHDHYDHLDYAAILQLAPKVAHFITPLGVGDRLIAWGVPAVKVQ